MTKSTHDEPPSVNAPGPFASTQPTLVRQVSWLGMWLLTINGIIGAGIFALPADAARLAGTFSPWIFVICAALILPILWVFAALASHFSETGGPALYVGTAFGRGLGFQAGWLMYLARLTAFSANLGLLIDTLGYFSPGASVGLSRTVLLFAVAALFATTNVIGVRNAIGSLAVLTVLKFLPLVALVGIGFARMPGSVLEIATASPAPGANVGAAIFVVIYAFVGFEAGLVPAGEAKNPTRDVPRALFLGLAVAALLYALLQLVSLGLVPELGATKRPLVEAAHVLLGQTGAVVIMAGLMASVGANVSTSMFTTPRITYSLAREGSLPAWFGAVHARFRTPARSIVFYAVVGFGLAAVGSFAWLAVLSVLVRLLLYVLCVASLPRVRARMPSANALRLPGGFAIPLAALGVCAWLFTQVKLDALLPTLGLVLTGALLYFIARRKSGASSTTGT